MDDIKLPPLPAIDDYLPTDGPRWTTANFIACVERYATDYARAALAAAPAPPEPMSVLTDKDIMKAAVSWREFDAPDECGPADRMVYGACRAVLAAYHAALQSKEQSNG